jgi:hypothetical protein
MSLTPEVPEVFFGYPSKPTARAETLKEGIKKLSDGGSIKAVSWEDLRTSAGI